MTARVLRFPARVAAAIFISEAAERGWLVLARGHGWLHGSRAEALADAQWLAWNLGLPVREVL